MKSFWLSWNAFLVIVLVATTLKADDLQLTLDRRVAYRLSPDSGGTWQLFARVVDTPAGVDGSPGIAGVRALLDNIDVASVSFNPAINPNGVATVQTIPGDPEGTVEIVYQQDLNLPTLFGVGVPPVGFPNRDVLVASGSYLSTRPVFGSNLGNLSDGDFLTASGTSAVAAAIIPTSTYILGDINGSNTVTDLDIQPFINRLPGAASPLPYHPAADINQSGHISNADIRPYISILALPAVPPPTVAVPEPASIGILIAMTSLIACSRGVR